MSIVAGNDHFGKATVMSKIKRNVLGFGIKKSPKPTNGIVDEGNSTQDSGQWRGYIYYGCVRIAELFGCIFNFSVFPY